MGPKLRKLHDLCIEAANGSGNFLGIDTSLNPSPGMREGSVAAGFAKLEEVPMLGKGASLAAVAEATMAMQDAFEGIKVCGYCGCMLPLCEDVALAESSLTIRELLSPSATCGVGVDTVLWATRARSEDLVGSLDAAAAARRAEVP